METTPTKTKANISEIQAKLAAMGFKAGKNLGMNILKQNEGETVFIRVTGPIATFTSKKIDPKTKELAEYEYVTVDNLETGESDMTYWLSGQIRYQFEELEKAGQEYVGCSFAITSLGQELVDGQKINQFNIQLIEN